MRTRVVFGVVILYFALAVPATWAQTSKAPQQPSRDETTSFRDYLAPYVGMDGGPTLFKEASPLAGFDQGTPRAYGVAIGFWGRGVLSGELDVAYHRNFFGPPGTPYVFTGGTGTFGSNSLITVTASFVVNPSIDAGRMRIRPYIFAGGGLMRSRVSGFVQFGKDTDNRGVLDLGAGLQLYPHKRIGIRADFRYNVGGTADSSENGWGWMDRWSFYRFVIGPSFTF